MWRWLAPFLTTLAAGCAATAEAPERPPDIVLVSLDTLRADRVGGELTPNLDRFAAEAVVFDDAYAQAPETKFSHASLLTGRYASELAPLDYGMALPGDVPTLATVLGLYGYRSAAFVSGGQLSEGFGLEQGFGSWTVTRHWGSLYHAVPPALDWLAQQDGSAPTLLFVHGYDAHARYLKPTPFGHIETGPAPWPDNGERAARLRDGIPPTKAIGHTPGGAPRKMAMTEHDMEHVRGVYDGAVRYLDAWFGLLMAGLAEQGRLEDTVVVVFSDHGEELGERGEFGHRHSLQDDVLRVPLMIRLPGGAGGGRHVTGQVALLDVMPTLLELTQAVAPGVQRGVSLAPALRGEPQAAHPTLFAEGLASSVTARSARGRLVFQGLGAEIPGLGDFIAAASPTGPAFGGSEGLTPAEAEALRDALVAWRRALPTPEAGAVDAEADEALRQRLRERGYWGR